MASQPHLGGQAPAAEPVYYNPLDPEAHADPYPQYHRLLAHAPIQRGPMGMWVLCRYADIDAVLRDTRFAHLADEAAILEAGPSAPGMATYTELSRWLLFKNPPDHTRLRGLVSMAFTPRAVEAMRPRTIEIVNTLVDTIVAKLAAGQQADLVADLALPLPVTVISELLGLPIEDHAQAREWAEAIAQALDPIISEEQALRADAAVLGLASYIGEVVTQRRRNPGPDLLSRLIEAEEGGAHLSPQELISTVGLLFGAGHETTRNLIGNGMLALLRNPAELARLRDDPTLIRGAVEELLRYDSPVQLVGRVATAPVEVGGQVIAAGEAVVLLIGAGNRDPEQFADPDRLDVARPNPRMLSFGGGIHFCLGAMLARMEAQLAIGTLLARAPEMAVVADALEWRPHITLRGLASLPVRGVDGHRSLPGMVKYGS